MAYENDANKNMSFLGILSHFALYIILSRVLKRFTIGQHERHFELPKQQFCWPCDGC